MLLDGNNFIRHHLKNDKLFAAGKIGATEIKILYYYFLQNKPEENTFHEGYINSGIFPKTLETFNYFCETYIESIKCLDLAPKWNGLVKQFEIDLYNKINPKCYNTPLEHLEPYYFDNPWTEFLKDKTVLVISPFTKSIELQYSKMAKIWNNKITNNFELKTIKFPFSIGISDEMKQWNSFKDCLEYFKNEIDKVKFDFCILGAGAYALPLCAHIKSKNISSLHLGGATQILFGIKGSRWDNMDKVSRFFNEHWIRPSADEIPSKHKINEGGCYW